MLVLTRKVNQKIQIGEKITVTVLEIVDGNKVRIGIQAPCYVQICRDDAKCCEPRGADNEDPSGDAEAMGKEGAA